MFSMVIPCEDNRFSLFEKTLSAYKAFGIPEGTEIIIPTRTLPVGEHAVGGYPVRFVKYEHDGEYFNPSKALNIGVRESKNEYIIITSPEVRPDTNVLSQLEEEIGHNVICQVMDEGLDGTLRSLVNSNYRSTTPSMYFLALFNKKDLIKINGWDEDFMLGYAWEDSDFGARWNRAGLPFRVRNDIIGTHQYHKRGMIDSPGGNINEILFQENNRKGVTIVKNGLRNVE